MKNLLCLTVMGSLVTLLLVVLKPKLLAKCGGEWYCRLWFLALLGFCFPYKLDVSRIFSPMGEISPIQTMPPPLLPVEMPIWEPSPETGGGAIAAGASSLERGLWTLYLIGLAAALVYYTGAYLLFWRRQRKSLVVDEKKRTCFQQICREMGLRKEPLLFESNRVSSPMLLGILHPQVLLPTGDFTEAELKMIFCHELSHGQRKDLLRKMAALAVHILHWFNPISLLMLRNIGEACEYACDEAVTKGLQPKERQAYGRLLLGQAAKGQKMPAFLAGLAGRGRQKEVLKRRIGVIMNGKKKKWMGITVAFVLGFLLGGNLFDFQPIYGNGETVTEEAQGENPPMQAGMELPKEWSEEEALDFAKDGLEKLFGAEKGELRGEAHYKGNGINENSVQPDGWFIQLDDNTRNYAVWLQETGRVCFRRGLPKLEECPQISFDQAEKNRLRESVDWSGLTEGILRENWGEQGSVVSSEPVDVSTDGLGRDAMQIGVFVTLADGTRYQCTFYPYDTAVEKGPFLTELIYIPKE